MHENHDQSHSHAGCNEEIVKLFGTKSTEEIRQIEAVTQNEILQKKEELRQMVGERYRDLIEAADTITEMNECANDIKLYCANIQKFCSKELHTTTKLNKIRNSKELDGYMEIASQVKILMELSENIWSAVEQGHLIKASYLYIEGNKILCNLNLDGSTMVCPVLQWFPVLTQQIQTLDELRSSIKKKCRQQLNDIELDIWLLTEAILAIIMLEKVSLQHVFEEFLNIRFNLISDVLISEKYASLPVKSKLVTVINAFIYTITQIYQIFVLNASGNDNAMSNNSETPLLSLVLQQLNCSDDQDVASNGIFARLNLDDIFDNKKSWKKYLPTEITKLDKVIGDTSIESEHMNLSNITDSCQHWIEKCQTVIRKEALVLLCYVNSFKELSSLREIIDSVLKSTEEYCDGKEDDEIINSWKFTCEKVIGRNINTWDFLLYEIFLTKGKELMSSAFYDLTSQGKIMLEKTANDLAEELKKSLEQDLNNFVWREDHTDVSYGTAWNIQSIGRMEKVMNGLEIKSLAVNPSHSKTYCAFNTELGVILKDLSYYLNLQGLNNGNIIVDKTPTFKLKQCEIEEMCAHFQECCSGSIICIFNSVQVVLETKKSTIKLETLELSDIYLHFSLLCKNFSKLCPRYEDACRLADFIEPIKRSQSVYSQVQKSDSVAWENISKILTENSYRLMTQWTEFVLISLVKSFHNKLLSVSKGSEVFSVLPQWTSVSIEEENEHGEKLTSAIKIPSSLSLHLLHLLNTVCAKVNKVGGHAFGQKILLHISAILFSLILQSFKNVKNVSEESILNVSQAWAVQMLFDLNVANKLLNSSDSVTSVSLFPNKTTITNETYTEIIEWLESFIDPFDLDVFSPYMTKNMQVCSQRFGLLMGLVIPSSKSQLLLAGSRNTHTMASKHNSLTISPDCGRFSYLPVTSRSSKSGVNAFPDSIQNQLPLLNVFQRLSDNEDRRMSQSKITSSLYSKLGALSSSWLNMSGET